MDECLSLPATGVRLQSCRSCSVGNWEFWRSATWWECFTSGAPSVCLSVTVGDTEVRGALGGMLQNWAKEVAVYDASCRPRIATLLRRLQDADGTKKTYGFTVRVYYGYRCLLSPSIIICVRSKAARRGLLW